MFEFEFEFEFEVCVDNGVALVESCSQLECLLSYISERRCSVVVFVRLNGVEGNDGSLLKIIEEGYEGVEFYTFKCVRNNKLSVFLKSIFFVLPKVLVLRPKRLYIGDYLSRWMRLFVGLYPRIQLFFLDDGLSTVSNYRRIKTTGRGSIITYLDLPSDGGVDVISLTRPEFVAPEQSREVWIIGMPMLEMSALKCDSIYYEYIRDVVSLSRASFPGVKIFYVPHRYEKGKINSLLSECGVDLLVTGMPVEDYIRWVDVVPMAVVGLYSTALINIELVFPQIKVFSFRIDLSSLEDDYRELAEAAYWYILQAKGIKVIC